MNLCVAGSTWLLFVEQEPPSGTAPAMDNVMYKKTVRTKQYDILQSSILEVCKLEYSTDTVCAFIERRTAGRPRVMIGPGGWGGWKGAPQRRVLLSEQAYGPGETTERKADTVD